MSKMPAIKAWSDYCFRLPSNEEVTSWSNSFEKSNLAICLGTASGIVALDIDTTDQAILDVILPMLPKSPVSKIGAKGDTRFFRYTGVESSQGLKFGGEMVIELLSNNKKTTIAPSMHPNGFPYTWRDGVSLLDVNKEELPMIPPALFASLEQKLLLKFPDLQKGPTGKLSSGRNDSLVSLCGTLIAQQTTMEEAITKLIEFDKENNEIPLFIDPEENYHTEPRTNALKLYSNVLESINRRRYRESKEYETPVATVINEQVLADLIEERGKSQISKENLRNQNQRLSNAVTAKKKCPCCNKWKRA
jgi:hypothetical protein